MALPPQPPSRFNVFIDCSHNLEHPAPRVVAFLQSQGAQPGFYSNRAAYDWPTGFYRFSSSRLDGGPPLMVDLAPSITDGPGDGDWQLIEVDPLAYFKRAAPAPTTTGTYSLGSGTRMAYQDTRPASVGIWEDFEEGARRWSPDLNRRLMRSWVTNTAIPYENAMNELLAGGYRQIQDLVSPYPWPGVKEANTLVTDDVISDTSLGTPLAKAERDRVRAVVHQACIYLREFHVTYGAITTPARTWFLRRSAGGHVEISRPIFATTSGNNQPTWRRAIAYALTLVNNSSAFPDPAPNPTEPAVGALAVGPALTESPPPSRRSIPRNHPHVAAGHSCPPPLRQALIHCAESMHLVRWLVHQQPDTRYT
ncbi:hypothetical protein BDK51DRAFT_50883 [Blyttiomyces helicus]|uniref:Uncharacterized protein n=1 Tax=Blyttiomyces helicus TaxID=388810 RepID=A0A4P9VYW1_9FUNG|nr:hypothetical protein BDK51DRAFT_50883 [Blyttiomyces helicus]|eukprot:RKO83518.1 hypothetical protein BDK51DRAFT_50883 [Blyttiomyces helicus]